VPAVAHDFSWSVSRHDSFASCRRRYYYAYYGAQEDPEIQRLKRLSALPLWAGNVVHETIEALLKERDTLPSETEQEAIVRAAVHERMLSDWRASEAGPLGFRLFEHEYGVPVEAEDKKIAVSIVRRSLRYFFRSPTLRDALLAGRGNWLSVEDLASFDVSGVTVFLRMDLAYRRPDGGVVIVDWKTGRNEGRFNEIQLAGYALYAAQQGWVGDPEEIETELAYLAVPRHVRRRVDGRTIERARGFIETSAASMKALLVDPLANVARLEDFPMVDRPQLCRRCNFRRLCFPRGEESPGAGRVAGA
jgi:CRISPR/Cas system-associated exonuclease Cas4 (RecB family)